MPTTKCRWKLAKPYWIEKCEMKQRPIIPEIPPEEQTPSVQDLLGLTGQLLERVQQQDEELALLKDQNKTQEDQNNTLEDQNNLLKEENNLLKDKINILKDEINILKGEKKRPVFKGSKLDKETDTNTSTDASSKPPKKRPGSHKRQKTKKLKIHEDLVIEVNETVPPGSRFKGYRNFVVQDLRIQSHNIRYRLAHWVTPEGKSLTGQLPKQVNNSHFGRGLVAFVLYQHHQCQVTQPLLHEQLQEWEVDISTGQINQILLEGKQAFHEEKDRILQSGLAVSSYITVDDSGARHQGRNGYVTQFGNDLFAWFQSTESKSRINFLQLLRAGHTDYVLSEDALHYMQKYKLPEKLFHQLTQIQGSSFADEQSWLALMDSLSITRTRHRRIATEGALLGSALSHCLSDDLVIVSDGARQFDILLHALCWIHSERLVHKMQPFNETHREEIAQIRDSIWDLYAQLKQYRQQPDSQQRERLRQRFDEIFTRKTSYATLNKTLKHIHNNKEKLLRVLDRPDIPLHTNGSETDIREYVKKRKVSGGTRSDQGRQCRDTFASLKKTCRKLDISFWDYLTDRLGIGNKTIPPLPDIIAERAAVATGY